MSEYWKLLRFRQVQERDRREQAYFRNVLLREADKVTDDTAYAFKAKLDAHFRRQDHVFQQKAMDIRTPAPLKAAL